MLNEVDEVCYLWQNNSLKTTYHIFRACRQIFTTFMKTTCMSLLHRLGYYKFYERRMAKTYTNMYKQWEHYQLQIYQICDGQWDMSKVLD